MGGGGDHSTTRTPLIIGRSRRRSDPPSGKVVFARIGLVAIPFDTYVLANKAANLAFEIWITADGLDRSVHSILGSSR